MTKYPWCDGIDIDLERGDGYSTHAASTAMFRNIYNTVKGYDSSKLMNICLPGMTSVDGSVGGENWCVYGDLNDYCDTASIMSYGMAWAGSAPGPVSPRSWLEGIYDYAVDVMDPERSLSMRIAELANYDTSHLVKLIAYLPDLLCRTKLVKAYKLYG
jgi:spore germination protein YaaH